MGYQISVERNDFCMFYHDEGRLLPQAERARRGVHCFLFLSLMDRLAAESMDIQYNRPCRPQEEGVSKTFIY